MDPKMVQDGEAGAQANLAGALKSSCFQDGPKMAQDGPE